MTPEKVKQAFQQCEDILIAAGIDEEKSAHDEVLESLDGVGVAAGHALYMVREGRKLVDQDRAEKAMRCLGFVQGVLWAIGLVTIEELKNMNKPPDRKNWYVRLEK